MIDISKLTLEEIIDLKRQLERIQVGRSAKSYGVVKVATNGHGYSQYESWDWTKSNYELAREHGKNYQVVRNIRQTLGKPEVKKTKWYPICLSWDWSLPNVQLSRQTGASVGVVQNWRRILNKPAGPKESQKAALADNPKSPDFTGVDWGRETDIEINFLLPNNLLQEIWVLRKNLVASHRSNHSEVKAAFHYIKGYPIPDEFCAMVESERQKAKEHCHQNNEKL